MNSFTTSSSQEANANLALHQNVEDRSRLKRSQSEDDHVCFDMPPAKLSLSEQEAIAVFCQQEAITVFSQQIQDAVENEFHIDMTLKVNRFKNENPDPEQTNMDLAAVFVEERIAEVRCFEEQQKKIIVDFYNDYPDTSVFLDILYGLQIREVEDFCQELCDAIENEVKNRKRCEAYMYPTMKSDYRA